MGPSVFSVSWFLVHKSLMFTTLRSATSLTNRNTLDMNDVRWLPLAVGIPPSGSGFQKKLTAFFPPFHGLPQIPGITNAIDVPNAKVSPAPNTVDEPSQRKKPQQRRKDLHQDHGKADHARDEENCQG